MEVISHREELIKMMLKNYVNLGLSYRNGHLSGKNYETLL